MYGFASSSQFGKLNHYHKNLWLLPAMLREMLVPFFGGPVSENVTLWLKGCWWPTQDRVMKFGHELNHTWFRWYIYGTPPKTNMERNTWWFGRCFSFFKGLFSGSMLVFKGVPIGTWLFSIPLNSKYPWAKTFWINCEMSWYLKKS